MSTKLWTCRKCLQYADLHSDEEYTVPVFVCCTDVDEVFFTDSDGRPLPCCQDKAYEALGHVLYWLRCTAASTGVATVYLYSAMAGGCGGPRTVRSSEVLEVAEFFRGGRTSVLSTWGVPNDSPKIWRSISTEPFISYADGGIDAPYGQCDGQSLWIQPDVDVTLRAEIRPPPPHCRVHLRAHFYDDGEGKTWQWIGCQTSLGAAFVGLQHPSAGMEGFYGYVQDSSGKYFGSGWKQSCVPRSVGWHLFELVWEDQELHVIIDSEPIAREAAKIAKHFTAEEAEEDNELQLFSSSTTGYGVWASVELLYTPRGQSLWAMAPPLPSPGFPEPWQVVLEEKGYWQDAGKYVIERVSLALFGTLVETWEDLVASFDKIAHDPAVVVHPVMESMLGRTYEIIERRPDGMYGVCCPDGYLRYFPPGCVSLAGPMYLRLNLHFR
eukprot:TRINITY_DN100929_c0_g1_i1.p1 TRINITY_DN100929_c0_g1~~TRINITY_DN100929_c0_g1_i1.p1  ORF type:complete len:450 (+),score=29.54 TRINITY_DN100929_c0_g1_i1:38-1351(+)